MLSLEEYPDVPRPFSLSTHYRKALARQLKTAQQLGRLRQVKYLLAILAVMDGQNVAEVAVVLRVHEKTVAAWVGLCCCDGTTAHRVKNLQAAPPKLTPTQKEALAILIDEGPVRSGFSGACWRSPMIEPLIYDRFGLFSNVFSIAQLLRNLSCSYQKRPSSRLIWMRQAAHMVPHALAPDAAPSQGAESPVAVWR